MNIRIDISKDAQGNHALHLYMDTVELGTANWTLPLGNDLIYALYKGINLEVKHFELMLSKAGREAQLSGPKEQAQVIEASTATAAESEVHT